MSFRPEYKLLKGYVFAIITAVILLGACPRCSQNEMESSAPNENNLVLINTPGMEPVTVTVETARTGAERSRGLMYREYLAPNHGMLFIFPEEKQLTFWMKNTRIELDMIFIRSDMTVLGCVERAEPETLASRFIEGKSQYVLEVVGGFCDEHGVGKNSKAKFSLPGINMHK